MDFRCDVSFLGTTTVEPSPAGSVDVVNKRYADESAFEIATRLNRLVILLAGQGFDLPVDDLLVPNTGEG